MCQLKQFDPAATQANLASANPQVSPVDPLGSPDLQQPPVKTPPAAMKDTKFAKLLKVAIPIVQGGAVGAFGGNWREPGSGSAAAQNFFGQRNELELRKKAMQTQLAQDAYLNQLRQSQETRNQFYDDYLRAETMKKEEPTPVKEPPTHVQQLSGYPGVGLETAGPEAGKTITLKDPNPQPAGHPINFRDQESPQAAGESEGVPLGPPEAQKEKSAKAKEPRPEKVTDTDAHGTSTTHYIDKNPESPTYMKEISPGAVATQHQKPRQAAPKNPKELSSGQKVQAYADYALQHANNDPKRATQAVQGLKSLPADMKALVIAQINKPKKFTIPQSATQAMQNVRPNE